MKNSWILAAFLLSACSVELAVPAEGTVECGSDAECPTQRVCAVDVGRCVDASEACVEQVDGAFRSVERGRRCSAEGGTDGVCVAAACVDSYCGDGIVDPNRLAAPEACDEGAGNSAERPDACRLDCSAPRCGDGVTDSGEECDDGDEVARDACLPTCVRNVCGDGVLNPAAEQCDDGNADTSDDCPAECRLAVCGDGHLWAGHEGCEDDDDDPNDGCDRCRPTLWQPRLLVGHGEGEGLGTAVALMAPYAVAADPRGGVFIADTWNNRVLRLDPTSGRVVVVAGTGESGFGGDGGPATRALLAEPTSLAVDAGGNLFIADSTLCVRRIDATTGTIQTVAGIPLSWGYSGDGGLATLAQITQPSAIAVDGRGSLYLADDRHHVVRRVDATTGLIETFAGTGACVGAGAGPAQGQASQVEICSPSGLATDLGGRLYVITAVRDAAGSTVRNDILGIELASREVAPIAGLLEGCYALASKGDGTLAVITYDQQVVRLTGGGEKSVIAGSGIAGFSGDEGPASAARLYDPMSVAWTGDGALYIADTSNHRVRRVDPDQTIRTVAGNGSALTGGCVRNTCRAPSDVAGVAIDEAGRILLATGLSHVVMRIDLDADSVEIAAGTHLVPGLAGDGGPATEALLYNVVDVAADPRGNLYLADVFNRRVRRVDGDTGVITTLAGGHGELNEPAGLALDAQGDLYIGDQRAHRVLHVDTATGQMTVFAGTGTAGFSGDGGPATQANLAEPRGLAFDGAGRLVIADMGNHVLRRVGTDGVIRTIAGTPRVSGFSGDGASPLAATLARPRLVAIAPEGDIYFTDAANERVRRISADGATIVTIAPGGEDLSSGDGGPAADARLNLPYGLAFDGRGGLLVSESKALRRIDLTSGIITTVFGPVMPPGDGPLGTSRLGTPGALTPMKRADGSTAWLVADGHTGRVRAVDLQAGTVETLVGYPRGFDSEGAEAWSSRLLGTPLGIAAAAETGVVFVSESTGHTIRRVDTSSSPWTITTLAGRFEEPGFSGAHLYGPRGLLLDPARGVLFVADTDNHVVRAIALESGIFVTVAGTPGVRGYLESASAAGTLLNAPQALTLANDGSLYVANTGNHRVRRITDPLGPAPGIETVTDYGVQVAAGEGSPADRFPIDTPIGLAVDRHGNLFVSGGTTVRVIDGGEDRLATGADSVRGIYGSEPRQGPLESSTLCLSGLHVAEGPEGEDARVLLLDSCQGYLIALDRQLL